MNLIAAALALLLVGSLVVLIAATHQSPHQNQQHHALTSSGHSIIVPLLESVDSMRAVDLACELASEREADIVLTSVIPVPYALGLDIPLPGAEDRARRLLSKGARIVNERGLEVESRILRDRSPEQAILELSREINAEAIVVGMGTASRWSSSQIGQVAAGLLLHAPCQVIAAKA